MAVNKGPTLLDGDRPVSNLGFCGGLVVWAPGQEEAARGGSGASEQETLKSRERFSCLHCILWGSARGPGLGSGQRCLRKTGLWGKGTEMLAGRERRRDLGQKPVPCVPRRMSTQGRATACRNQGVMWQWPLWHPEVQPVLLCVGRGWGQRVWCWGSSLGCKAPAVGGGSPEGSRARLPCGRPPAPPPCQEQENVLQRVLQLPVVSGTCECVQKTYTSTKEAHPLVASVCNAYEKGVQGASSLAAWSMEPVVRRLSTQCE